MQRSPSEPDQLHRAFLLLWLGETAFAFGAALLGFALGIWVYRQTGSAEQFSLAIVSATLPAIVLLPLAGSLADRFDRRWVIAVTDALFVFMTLALAGLFFSQRLAVHHLFAFNAASAVLTAMRAPAYKACVSAMVPADRLTRANGLIGLGLGASQLVAPLVAGGLMAGAGLGNIMLIELALATAGAIAVFGALSRARQAIGGTPTMSPGPAGLLQGAVTSLSSALSYFLTHQHLAALLLYTVVQKGLLTLVASMMTPLVLATHSSSVLGLVMTGAAVGGLLGSGLLAALNPKKRLMTWILVLDACLSLCVLVAGVAVSPVAWGTCAFLAAFAGSASEGCAATLWMRSTPKEKQGSIFALIGMASLIVVSITVLGGGVFSERVLEPAMAAEGMLQASVGAWLGTGKGRGLGLLFVVCGGACAVISLTALARANLKRLDEAPGDTSVVGSVL
jgi:diaminobutyrate-2-oxoglutarate transaminase